MRIQAKKEAELKQKCILKPNELLTAVTHLTFIRDVECLTLLSVTPRLLRTPCRFTIRNYYISLFQ
jgi:hypothetical protein